MVETPSRRFPTPRIRCSIAWAARRNWAASSRRTTPAIPERTPGAAASGRDYVFQSCFDLHGGEARRSEEHTSELQSRLHLVCRLLLEKKKKKAIHRFTAYLHDAADHLT